MRVAEALGGMFVGTLTFGLLAAPLAVEGQRQDKVWRIGVIHVGLDHVPPSLAPLREELRTLGYEDGRNIRLDFRNLADQAAAHTVARQIVGDRVDLIVAFEEQAMRGVKAATSEIPVVFLHLVDPVADGFIESLARPGGNVTGFITYSVSPADSSVGRCSSESAPCSRHSTPRWARGSGSSAFQDAPGGTGVGWAPSRVGA
jgi:putative ABC transport system substrate-binding protein